MLSNQYSMKRHLLPQPSIFLVCIFLLLMAACRKQTTNPTTKAEVLSEKSVTSKGVYMYATAKDAKTLEFVSVLDYSKLAGSPFETYTMERIGDGLHIRVPEISQPQILEIMAFNGPEFYNTRVFVTPQDSLSFYLEGSKIIFTDKKAAARNFFGKLTTPETQWPNFEGDIHQYKKEVVAIRDFRKSIWSAYKEKNKTSFSDIYIEHVEAEMYYEYLYQLASPRSKKPNPNAAVRNYYNDGDGLLSTLRDSRYNPEKDMLNFTTYYDSLSIAVFQNEKYINNDYFKRSLNQMIRHYFAEYDYLDYSKETFLAEKKFIDSQFQGDLKNYALGKLISDYFQKGFGRGEHDLKIIRSAIAELKSSTSRQAYLDEIEVIETSLDILGNTIPEYALQEKLVDMQLDTLTMGELIERTTGQVRVIDVWAGWCYPCLLDMKLSVDFKKQMTQKEGISWIYLSLDNEKDWPSYTKKVSAYTDVNQHYRFVNPYKSRLLKILKARVNNKVIVPRYTIMNRDGSIALSNAPRPSDTLRFMKDLKDILTPHTSNTEH